MGKEVSYLSKGQSINKVLKTHRCKTKQIDIDIGKNNLVMRFKQTSLRSLFIVVAVACLPLTLFVRNRSEYLERLQVTREVEQELGSVTWMQPDELVRYEHGGMPCINTVESVGAREFWSRFLTIPNTILHLDMSGACDAGALDQLRSCDSIVSVNLCDWIPANGDFAFTNSLTHVQIESSSDDALKAMLRSVYGSNCHWLSVASDTFDNNELKLLNGLPLLRVVSLQAFRESPSNSAVLELRGLDRLEELHLFGFDLLDFATLVDLLEDFENLKMLQVSDHQLSASERSRIVADWPLVEVRIDDARLKNSGELIPIGASLEISLGEEKGGRSQ